MTHKPAMPTILHCTLLLLALLVSTLQPSRCRAQELGFALDHFNPAERGSEWFAADTLDLRGDFRAALGITGSWAYRPLVARAENDDFERSIVRNQFVAHLGGSLVLSDRVRVGLDVPFQAYADGFAVTIGNGSFAPPKHKTTLGDIRISGDVRLLGKYGDTFTLAAGLMLWLPSGERASYSGDGTIRIMPQLLVAGDIKQFAYAARVGFSIRPKNDDFADSYVGSSIVLALAGGVRVLDKRLLVGPELLTQTAVSDGRVLAMNNAPLELVLGAHYTLPDGIRFGAGFGMGLTSSFRAPQHRGLLSVEWAPGVPKKEEPIPAPMPSDRDHDDIFDAADSCPDQFGQKRYQGCPAPEPEPEADRDHDAIVDSQDKCPDAPGEQAYQGCPPPDRDHDQVLDQSDACPDEPGLLSSEPAKNGCPGPKDSDNDGILDENDACPSANGPWNEDPKRSGCPKAFVEAGQIKILDQVKFQTGKATIVPGQDSEEVLIAVWELLEEHPEITKLRVEGHTDNQGDAAKNRVLSQKRAAAVVDWLTKAGIAASHLSSEGFGPDRPIADNATDEGRRQNRRVEFHIQN